MFLNCGAVVFETPFINSKRSTNTALSSFKIEESFYQQKLRVFCKFYEIKVNACSRCLEYRPIANKFCSSCEDYL